MRYSASTLVEAGRPTVLTIGRSSHWLGRWWQRAFRTWRVRPVSVEQMLALQAARSDARKYARELGRVLQEIFPNRWWYRITGDPVRLVWRLPDDVRSVVLRAVLTRPESDDEAGADDEIEIIRRAQRFAVYGKEQNKPGISLALAASAVRAVYGDAWYYAPSRWPTSDGYVPFALVWVEYLAVFAHAAHLRMIVADGLAVERAKDPRGARRTLERLAFPTEIC